LGRSLLARDLGRLDGPVRLTCALDLDLRDIWIWVLARQTLTRLTDAPDSDMAGRPLMPLCALEEIHEVHAKCLVRLTHLPVLDPAVPLQFLAEPPHLVGQGLVGGRARQKPPHPAHEVGRRRRSDQLGLEQELSELLQ